MTDIDILAALNFRLSEFLTVNPIDVDYPNVKYTATEGTPYIKVDLIPSSTEAVVIGTESPVRHIGIYQTMLFVPKGTSFAQSKPIIENLWEYFKMNTGIIFNNVKLRVTRFMVEQYQEDDTWFIQPISIYYRTDLEN